MTKKLSIMLVFVFVMMALSVPTFAQDDPWADVDPSGQEVLFWYRVTGQDEEALQVLISEFNETNEWGITVTGVTQGGYSELADKMIGVIGTDDAPNVVIAYQNNMLDYYALDGLAVLNELEASPTWGLTEEDNADFFSAFLNQDVFSAFDSVRLGMPPQRSMAVMFYNVDWLNELYANGYISFEGFPETPEQFMEATCAATANPFSGATGDPELSVGYDLRIDASQLASWVFAFSGDIFDYEANQYTFDSAESIAAAQYVSELFAEGCAVDSVGYDNQASFGQGLVLATSSSTSGLSYWQGAVDDGYQGAWDAAQFPFVGEEPALNVYGASVSVGTGEPEEVLASWLFIKFLTSTESSATWSMEADYFPVRASSAALLVDHFEANPVFKSAFDMLELGRTEPPVPGYDAVRRAINEYLVRLADGEDAETLMLELNELANEELADAMSAFE